MGPSSTEGEAKNLELCAEALPSHAWHVTKATCHTVGASHAPRAPRERAMSDSGGAACVPLAQRLTGRGDKNLVDPQSRCRVPQVQTTWLHK